MNIIIGSDHGGFEHKKEMIEYLKGLNYEVEDVGPYSYEPKDDYPVYAKKVCKRVLEETGSLGVLMCGTGIGMSIVANKIKGIRCAKIDNEEEAKLAKLHNNANVMAVSSKKSDEEINKLMYYFINTPFSNEERHINRINKIEEI